MSISSKKKQSLMDPSHVPDKSRIEALCALSATFNGAALAQAFSIQGELDLNELIKGLATRCQEVRDGNLRRAENMLIAQAHSLDAMFVSLARRAVAQEGLIQFEAHMKLALKAQSQGRATLETLAAIKNPPVVYAKQANFANGPQQVNNDPNGLASVREIEIKPNELLEANHGQRLDTRTTSAPRGSHQAMATVEAVHRTANAKGQGRGKPKRLEGRSASMPTRRRSSPK